MALRFFYQKMIQDLISTLQAKHFRELAVKGELACPNCGMTASRIPDASGGALRCKTCGVTALLEEWRDAYRESLLVGDADQPPSGTKIIRSHEDQIISWRIPASGESCFVLLFGIIWTVVTALFSFGFLVGRSSVSSESGEVSGIWLVPFFGAFWAIGLGLLYIELRSRYARQLVTIEEDKITLRRELFGRRKEVSMALADVVSIVQKEFYQKNYKPIYGIEIKGTHSKIRFGSGLTPDEKSWLVADLRRVVKSNPIPQYLLPITAEGAGHHRSASFSFCCLSR